MTEELIYSDLLADDPSFAPLIEEFVTDLRAGCADLMAALATHDVSAIQVIAHTWRGSAGGHGFDLLTEAAGELYDAVKRTGAVDESVRREADRFLAVAARIRPGRPNGL